MLKHVKSVIVHPVVLFMEIHVVGVAKQLRFLPYYLRAILASNQKIICKYLHPIKTFVFGCLTKIAGMLLLLTGISSTLFYFLIRVFITGGCIFGTHIFAVAMAILKENSPSSRGRLLRNQFSSNANIMYPDQYPMVILVRIHHHHHKC